MFRRSLLSALAGAAIIASPAAAQDVPARVNPIDDVNRCQEYVPSAAVATIGDQHIPLRVLVLHDDLSEDTARTTMAGVAKIYSQLNIDVSAGYRAVDFPDGTANEYFARAKAAVGGGRPAGYDVVVTMTGGKIVGDAGTTAGQADCIGGVQVPTRAFAVTTRLDENDPIGPGTVNLPFQTNANAEVVAHEIGHLMGAQHHHQTCGDAEDPGDPMELCSLMTNDAGLMSSRFSQVEGRVVRGFAERFLPSAPYDGPEPIDSPQRTSGTVSLADPAIGWSANAAGYGVTAANEQRHTAADACEAPLCHSFALKVADAGDLTINAVDEKWTGNVQVDVVKPDGTTVTDYGAPHDDTTVRIPGAAAGDYTVRVLTNQVFFVDVSGFTASARLSEPQAG